MRTFRHPSGIEQRLAVADLTNGGVAAFELLLGGGRAEVVYSDPPWSPGNEKWWRRHGGHVPPDTYDAFLDAWVRCVVEARPEHVLVEQSINDKHQRMLLDAIERGRGWELPLVERFECMYGSPRRPNALLHFGREKLSTDPSGMSGEAMTRTALAGLPIRPRMTIADPCTGLGMSSRIAHELGCHFVGTELTGRRLDQTIVWLIKHGYVEA